MQGVLWHAIGDLYRLRGSSEAWIAGLLETLRPSLDRGLGVGGYCFDARRSRADDTHLTALGTLGDQLAMVARILATIRPLNERSRRILALRDGCGTASEVMTPRLFRSMPHLAALTRMSPIRDFFGIVATDPGCTGSIINAPLARQTGTSLRIRRRWGPVAAHLAAALRLQRALQGLTATGDRRSVTNSLRIA